MLTYVQVPPEAFPARDAKVHMDLSTMRLKTTRSRRNYQQSLPTALRLARVGAMTWHLNLEDSNYGSKVVSACGPYFTPKTYHPWMPCIDDRLFDGGVRVEKPFGMLLCFLHGYTMMFHISIGELSRRDPLQELQQLHKMVSMGILPASELIKKLNE